MSRNHTRWMGVMAGVLAGTIAALLFRGPFRTVDNGKALSGSGLRTIEVDDDPLMPPAIPDPGQRRELQRLVAQAKQEPGWLKEFEFTERSGRAVTSNELRGEPYIACFFFTTCPGTCTRQSNQMQLLQSKFKGKKIKLVSISVDPEIDTPQVLSEYAEKFQADKDRWLFLTGAIEKVVRVGTEKFFLGGVEKRGHPDRFCLVNAAGDIVGSYVWLDIDQRELLVEHVNELLR